MAIEVPLVQLLVLLFTGALWWIARRDLAVRTLPPVEPPADTQELEQLCATLEALVTDLARRLEAVERQTAAQHPVSSEPPLPTFSEIGALLSASLPSASLPSMPEAVIPETVPPEAPPVLAARPALVMETLAPSVSPWHNAAPPEEAADDDPRHATLHALWEQGVTDPVELARRTGLGRGEVDLLLSLRGRRAL